MCDSLGVIKKELRKESAKDNDKTKEPLKTITRGDTMQAMRQKCNQLIFQAKRAGYHKGEIAEKFFNCFVEVMSIKKWLLPSCNM